MRRPNKLRNFLKLCQRTRYFHSPAGAEHCSAAEVADGDIRSYEKETALKEIPRRAANPSPSDNCKFV